MILYPKSPRYENRKLLDLAHRIEYCVNCGAAPEYGCAPCHSNKLLHGKGRGHKAHDDQHFAGCDACHKYYDGLEKLDPTEVWGAQDRDEFFTVMRDRTFRRYWDNEWLKVVK